MEETKNTKPTLKGLVKFLDNAIKNDSDLELEDNLEGYSEEEIKQQQEIALIKMAAIKKTNHNIGFDKLVMILDDVVTSAGYGHIKSLIIDKYAYER